MAFLGSPLAFFGLFAAGGSSAVRSVSSADGAPTKPPLQPVPSHVGGSPWFGIVPTVPSISDASFVRIASFVRFFLSRSALSFSRVTSRASASASLAALSRASSSAVGGAGGCASRYFVNNACILGPTPLMPFACVRCRTLIGYFATLLTTF